MFIQAACGSDVKTQQRTNVVGLILVCLSIITAYVFQVRIGVDLPRYVQIQKSCFDLRMASAAQYTISLAISQKQVEQFMKTKFDQDSEEKGFALQFEEHLT